MEKLLHWMKFKVHLDHILFDTRAKTMISVLQG